MFSRITLRVSLWSWNIVLKILFFEVKRWYMFIGGLGSYGWKVMNYLNDTIKKKKNWKVCFNNRLASGALREIGQSVCFTTWTIRPEISRLNESLVLCETYTIPTVKEKISGSLPSDHQVKWFFLSENVCKRRRYNRKWY